MVSGSISLLCSRFFSPFLHSTGPLSVSQEYLALRDGPRKFTQDFSCPALLRIPLGVRAFTCTGLSPILPAFPYRSTLSRSAMLWSYNPGFAETIPVWALPRSIATTRGIICYFLLLGVMRCFSSPRSPTLTGIQGLQPCGLPHSEIFGSKVICTFPKLIAAYHVLLRL